MVSVLAVVHIYRGKYYNIQQRGNSMSDEKTPPELDIQQIVEALLNICGQAAEMQIDEESRNAIYDMCDAVAEHHGIPRFDAVIEQQEDGSSRVTYYGEGVGSRVDDTNFKPKLKLVVDNGQEDDEDDPTTLH